MCGSFGGKGWHDNLQYFEEQTERGISGCEAYYAQKLDRLEHVSNRSAATGKERTERMT